MSTGGNGRGSDAWFQPWTQLRIDRRSPGYCRATFDHPPTNAITTTTVVELAELVALIEEDVDLNVVVFDSAIPDFYLVGPMGTHAWVEVLARLSRAPVVSIASIRGRVCEAGREFALACDLRFASREKSWRDDLVGLRMIADDQLDGEVDAIAARLARLDHDAIARTKSHVDRL